MRAAFVVIDMQRQFLEGRSGPIPRLARAVEIIDHVAGQFRRAGLPVVHVLDVEEHPAEHPEAAVVAGITTEADDLRVYKVHGNGFRDTMLAEVLGTLDASFLLVAGFKAEGCVLSTVKGAEDRGFKYALLREAVLSPSAENAAFVERISPLVSYEAALAFIGDRR